MTISTRVTDTTIGNTPTKQRRTRGPAEIPCITCGFLFEPSRRDSQYCSDKCKQKGYRLRKDASLPLSELELRHARLTAQIERDNRIAWEHAQQFFFAGWLPDSPKLCITRFYGAGFPASGREVQAKRRLKKLEARMQQATLDV